MHPAERPHALSSDPRVVLSQGSSKDREVLFIGDVAECGERNDAVWAGAVLDLRTEPREQGLSLRMPFGVCCSEFRYDTKENVAFGCAAMCLVLGFNVLAELGVDHRVHGEHSHHIELEFVIKGVVVGLEHFQNGMLACTMLCDHHVCDQPLTGLLCGRCQSTVLRPRICTSEHLPRRAVDGAILIRIE